MYIAVLPSSDIVPDPGSATISNAILSLGLKFEANSNISTGMFCCVDTVSSDTVSVFGPGGGLGGDGGTGGGLGGVGGGGLGGDC